MPKKKANGKVRKVAAELAIAGMQGRIFETKQPAEVAEYCIAIALAIENAEIESD